jgi:peptidoglycan/xylan/chitin deacetylase (PgdA/CDA1 family)
MPAYIAAYDVENLEKCLPAMRQIVALHRRMNVPATMFVVGRLLEEQGREYRELWADEQLFEVASHTYSHRLLKDHPVCGPAATPEQIRREVLQGVACVEQTFQRKCRGLRPGCGFDNGLKNAPLPLSLAQEAKLDYVSSQLWGPDFTLPAPLVQAYTYEESGVPGLWELPGHGWHDNVLKAPIWKAAPRRMVAWPPLMPNAVPPHAVNTSDEEFAVNKAVIDYAIADQVGYVSLVWHPWSLHGFDATLRNIELTFQYVQQRGLVATTYARYCDRMKSGQAA